MLINVVLVDDNDLLRKGMAKLLAAATEIAVVAEANSGEAAIALVKAKQPHVVLIDLQMPGIDGLETSKQILAENPRIKTIALTAYREEPIPKEVLAAGFSGYLSKNITTRELALAIKSVYAGGKYFSSEIAQTLALNAIDRNLPFTEKLSSRELEIMMQVVNGHSISDIASMLSLTTKTINSFRYRVFKKLAVKNDVELARFVAQNGIIEPV